MSLPTKSMSFYADKSLKLLPQFFSKSFPLSVFNILVEEIFFFFPLMTALLNKDP